MAKIIKQTRGRTGIRKVAFVKRVGGWWCPKCHCLMMAKKRKNGGLVSCDCFDVQMRPGNGIEWHEEMRGRDLLLTKRQKIWKAIWVKDHEKGKN